MVHMSNRGIANVALCALGCSLLSLVAVVIIGSVRIDTELKLMNAIDKLSRTLGDK